MAEIIGAPDSVTAAVKQVLERYEHDHPGSSAHIRRQNSASVRVRIIDPAFAKISKDEQFEIAWRYIDELDEATVNQVTMVLTLAPQDVKMSFANFEFNNPLPSQL